MKPSTTIANLVNSIGSMDIEDDEDTDDEMVYRASMVKQRIARDAPSDVIEVRAHLNMKTMNASKIKCMQSLMEEQTHVFLEKWLK